jgi:hypothetical protein
MRDLQLLGAVLDLENFVLRNGENQTVYRGTLLKFWIPNSALCSKSDLVIMVYYSVVWATDNIIW